MFEYFFINQIELINKISNIFNVNFIIIFKLYNKEMRVLVLGAGAIANSGIKYNKFKKDLKELLQST
jgi:hypothetical protein